MFPGVPEYLSLIHDLLRHIVTQIFKPLLELLLEGVQRVVHVIHSLNSLFLVLLNFGVGVRETLLKQSFGLDSRIFHVLKVI